MTLQEFHNELKQLPFGKRLPTAIYVYRHVGGALGESLKKLVEMCAETAKVTENSNILKLRITEFRISFLTYQNFFTAPHPSLQESTQIDLSVGSIKTLNYSNSPNPPILHRKETFLPENHKNISKFRSMTEQEEKAGLYENPKTIEFKLNWERLLVEKILSYEGHDLIELKRL